MHMYRSKKSLLFLIATMCIVYRTGLTFANNMESNVGSIKIMVENCDAGKGKIMIALHNTKKTFLKKVAPFQRAILPNIPGVIEYTFENIPYGEYGVAVFQDDNENMDLDLGMMFIPKEKYGFSNNIRSKYGPPSYDKVKFELNQPNLEMKIAISTP